MWTSLSSTLALLGVGETPEEAYANYVSTVIPQGEAQTPEDIAEGVLYLITAPHVTGIALSIDGLAFPCSFRVIKNLKKYKGGITMHLQTQRNSTRFSDSLG